MVEILLLFYEGLILLGYIILKGGYEFIEEFFWVFEVMNESELQLKFVGMGFVSFRLNVLFILLLKNSYLDISGEGEFDILRLLKNSECSLIKISGVFSVVLYDGVVCIICIQ